MALSETPLRAPRALIFDWHGTLVDTLDAMFAAMEEMLPRLEELDLIERLLPESRCLSPEDAKLVRYIRIFRRLHPKILAERRVSRTDIFNAVFGDDIEAKNRAHLAYNDCYRNHYGKVHPYQQGVKEYLRGFKQLGLGVAVATNRSREFLDHELQLVDEGQWRGLIDVSVCADDVTRYKPDPQQLFKTLEQLDAVADGSSWYIGDSLLDMLTAKKAGVGAVYYNGACAGEEELTRLFDSQPQARPDAVVNSFDQLWSLLAECFRDGAENSADQVQKLRPGPFVPPAPPPQRIEPDWHPAVADLQPPEAILFDWHATLVDTLDAMYHAVDDMLPDMRRVGLFDKLVDPADSKTPEDARLVEYVQSYAKLHPRVKADRKISRTDIFEVLFGSDQQAKQQAHLLFNHHYRNHYGTVLPFEPQVRQMLEALNELVQVGVITNRDREFFEHELAAVEGSGWTELFSSNVCGDDTPLRKPHPDQLLRAADDLARLPSLKLWYVGDSTTDVIAAKRAGMTAVFFNGAQWDQPWLEKIFPGDERFPYQPDVVVNDFSEFWALVLACLHPSC